jgi:hypothetical protein
MITLGELLHGTDEDFVVNLYLATLGRWPDEMGFTHHLGLIAGKPEARAGLVQGLLNSEEARQRRPAIHPDPEPVPAEQALAAQLRLRTQVLYAALTERRPPSTEAQPSALAGEILALGTALDGLRAELSERIAALEAALAGRVPTAPNLSPAISLDYVNDLVEAAQAPLLRRIRALELRLIEQGDVPRA